MRVLLINKFYYLSGGAERYVFDWEQMLKARGHDTMVFSMQHPRNRPSPQEEFFSETVSFKMSLPVKERLKVGLHSIWFKDAGRRLEALMQAQGQPDLAHVHSYLFQLTPAILRPLCARGIPIVQTCHEYAHICVNQHMYNWRTRAICEQCLQYGRLAPLWTRCVKASLAASAAACAAGCADRFIGRSRKRISKFIAVSEFMRRKLIEGGMPASRVAHVPNFIDATQVAPSDETGEYFLFLGRLTPPKGASTFLDAAALLPEIPMRLVGGGELETSLRERVERQKLQNVTILGHLEGEALWQEIRQARAVVVPSEWYEPFGLVILEAMAAARPVIASNIAGPAEIVRDGMEGLLFPMGDAQALAEAIRRLWLDPAEAQRLGRAGRERVEKVYDADSHYGKMMAIFEEAMR